MKIARIFLVSAALVSAAACSTDRITGVATPEAPAAAKTTATTTTAGSTSITATVNDPTLINCTTSTQVIDGIPTLVTTCASPWTGGGN